MSKRKVQKSRAFKVPFAVLTMIALVGSFYVPLTARATTVCSATIGSATALADTTFTASNDPDSANVGGNWALDNFSRHVQIWQEDGHYCAQATDSGTFTTFGGSDGISPQSGTALPQVVTGTMTGNTHGEITGGTFDGSTSPANVDCNTSPTTCSDGLTHYWVSHYFGNSGSYNYDWGWTYTSTLGEAWINSAAVNSGDIHAVVNNNTHVGYPTIQSAVDAATAGDTILVGAGTFNEHVVVNKALTLDGAQHGNDGRIARGAESIVDGQLTGAPFLVSANNVTLDGFKIQEGQNGNNAGIATQAVSDLQIVNNVITNNTIGIYPNCAGDCLIKQNLFDGNNIEGSAGGSAIYTEHSNGLTIDQNKIVNHTINNPVIFAETSANAHTDLAFTNNTLDNAYGLYILAINGGTFSGNTIHTDGFTALSFSGGNSNLTITNNVLSNNARGVRIENSPDYGLTPNSNFVLHLNKISGNTDYGVGVVDGEESLGYASGSVNAEKNWWGSSTGPTHASNTSGTGDKVTDRVDFTPWCANADCTSFKDNNNPPVSEGGGSVVGTQFLGGGSNSSTTPTPTPAPSVTPAPSTSVSPTPRPTTVAVAGTPRPTLTLRTPAPNSNSNLSANIGGATETISPAPSESPEATISPTASDSNDLSANLSQSFFSEHFGQIIIVAGLAVLGWIVIRFL